MGYNIQREYGWTDDEYAEELADWLVNDYDLYRQRYQPFVKNYARKMASGKFKRNLAIKGLANNLAKDVEKKMYKNSRAGQPPTMSQSVKNRFGKYALDYMMEEIVDVAREIKQGIRDGYGNIKRRD